MPTTREERSSRYRGEERTATTIAFHRRSSSSSQITGRTAPGGGHGSVTGGYASKTRWTFSPNRFPRDRSCSSARETGSGVGAGGGGSATEATRAPAIAGTARGAGGCGASSRKADVTATRSSSPPVGPPAARIPPAATARPEAP